MINSFGNMKFIFSLILVMHGLIHLVGFAKALGYEEFTHLTPEIPMQIGVLWLMTSLLLVVTSFLFLLDKQAWSIWGIIAAIISQVLIVTVWQDAKYGTVNNVIILIAVFLSTISSNVENAYLEDV
jgi:hypothetical protein